MLPARLIKPAMLLRDYRKLGNISLADMLEKLKATADSTELDKLHRSTILRHESGERFPNARMQQLYIMATDGAVRPEDWVSLQDSLREKEGANAES
jgi:hypothetical protein